MTNTGSSGSHSQASRGGLTADHVAAVALDRKPSQSEWPQVYQLPASQGQVQTYAPKPNEAFISRYFEFGQTIVVCGAAGLADFIPRGRQLEHLIESCRELGKTDPIAQRFVGPLDSCLIRRNKTWSDLGQDPLARRFVIALDFRRGRLYAVRERDNGERDEICYTELPTNGSPLVWQHLCGLPAKDSASFIDASHFVQTASGLSGMVRVRAANGTDEHRLLTIEEVPRQIGCIPVANWSEPMSEYYAVLRTDHRTVLGDLRHNGIPTGLLIEIQTSDGSRLERLHMKCWPLPVYAYFDLDVRSSQAPKEQLPPVLTY